jgi:hypothetical protein
MGRKKVPGVDLAPQYRYYSRVISERIKHSFSLSIADIDSRGKFDPDAPVDRARTAFSDPIRFTLPRPS